MEWDVSCSEMLDGVGCWSAAEYLGYPVLLWKSSYIIAATVKCLINFNCLIVQANVSILSFRFLAAIRSGNDNQPCTGNKTLNCHYVMTDFIYSGQSFFAVCQPMKINCTCKISITYCYNELLSALTLNFLHSAINTAWDFFSRGMVNWNSRILILNN